MPIERVCCVCGKHFSVSPSRVRNGAAKSCSMSCAATARLTTHGMSKTSYYKVWAHIKDRCTDPNHDQYADYGGRGIKMCERWFNSFEAFLEDMGPRPPGMSIDRINNDGDYEPSNCRWATRYQQNNNHRRNRFLVLNGKRQTMRQWSDELGLPYTIIAYRAAQGWDDEKTLTTPPMPRGLRARYASSTRP